MNKTTSGNANGPADTFVHLHTHSEYSMLQGAARIPTLLDQAASLGQKHLALTDHGAMFGILEFYNEALKRDIHPIIGCDFYLAPDSRHNRVYEPGNPIHHKLILLAETDAGYKNLIALCSAGYLEGYCQKPRIDRELLKAHAEGLICLSSNFKGEPGYWIHRKSALGGEKVNQWLTDFLDIFGKENLFLCLQDHGLPQEREVNAAFRKLSKEQGVPLVAVNDVHYVYKEDSAAHDVLQCIEGGWKMQDPNRTKMGSDDFYLKSSREMADLFPEDAEALENTVRIAERCKATIEFGKLYWPRCPIPEEYSSDDAYLAHLAARGLKEKYKVTPELKQRLQYELDVMQKMGVAGYMLIVQDFINAAKERGIPVGPGRGSAVGSLVSYCIGITDVDPMRFNLLFERFLNPERVSMPDIDTDFSDHDRGKVIQYVVDKYGKDSVAQIVTYGRMKAKMVLRDVGRVMGFEAQEINRICKLFPPDKPFATLNEAVESSPPLKEALSGGPETVELLEIARKLEGFVRQAGMHAAAVIIAPEPLVHFAPLFKQPGSDQVMIQYDKQYSEDIGLLKMDFLGLRNLSVIQECIETIKNQFDVNIDPLHLPEKDPKTLELLGKGLTVGVFQFESAGMQDYLRKLKPTGIEDLIAMNALYRPGPIENIPQYINRKNGSEAPNYFHDDLKPILAETYGVIVYQEQVMQIAQDLSGFTLGGADEMRRAMAKKKEDKMAKLKPEFISGAEKKGYEKKLAEKIWDILVPFSSYAFNKSHSAAYATIAYQTAYLKAHYPAQFLAANMSSEMDNTDRLVILLNDCRQLDIEVKSPNINLSRPKFLCEDGAIVYGLGGIKNVGVGAAAKVLEERKANGDFKSVQDICLRLDAADLNRRAIESLIYAGALDELPGNRAQQYASVEQALALAGRHHRDKALGQTTLFEMEGDGEETPAEELLPVEVDAWPYNEILAKEKEVLGLYLSGHPLEPYRMELENFSASALDAGSLSRLREGSSVILGGMLAQLRTRISQKDNRTFAFGVLEDFLGKIEVVFWSDAYEKMKDQLEIDSMLLIKGVLKHDAEGRIPYKLIADKAMPLSEARLRLAEHVHLKVNIQGLQEESLEKIYRLTEANEGYCHLILHLDSPQGEYRVKCTHKKVSSDTAFTESLEEIVGKQNVWLSKNGVGG